MIEKNAFRRFQGKISSLKYMVLFPFKRVYQYYKANGFRRTAEVLRNKIKELWQPHTRTFPIPPIRAVEFGRNLPHYRRPPIPADFLKSPNTPKRIAIISGNTLNQSIKSLFDILRRSGHVINRTNPLDLLRDQDSSAPLPDIIILHEIRITKTVRDLIIFAHKSYVPIVYLCDSEIHPDTVHPDEIRNRKLSKERVRLQELYETFRACDYSFCTSSAIQEWSERNYKHSFLLGLLDSKQDVTSLSSVDIVSEVLAAYQKKHMPKFSIVSILHGKAQQIEFVLHSYFRQSYQGDFEIVFIDDQSPDESIACVRQCLEDAKQSGKYQKLPEIRILSNEQNMGNCISRNRGIQASNGDIIIIIDADCMVNRDFLQSHADAHSFDDCDVVIGPLNLETNGKDPLTVLQELENDTDRLLAESLPQDSMALRSFVNCITRNFSIKSSYITDNLFDPLFSYSRDKNSGFGWEDVEMGYRLYKRGARIKFTPDAFSIHISHPSNVEEKTKPYRSLKNFRRLFEKHPELLFVTRRWALTTYSNISAWLQQYKLPINEDKMTLDRTFQRFTPPPFYINSTKRLKVLTYRWHVPHQYELYKLPHEFTLITDLGGEITKTWDLRQRPLPSNVRLRSIDEIDVKDYDFAILHFDENVLTPENTLGVLNNDWGRTFKWFQENINIPKAAICHGTPQFYGQYNINYKAPNLLQTVEVERERLVNFLGDTLVIVNSYQARSEWNFGNSRVVWHGFDPSEFPPATFEKGMISPFGPLVISRPHYRGCFIDEAVLSNFPQQYMPATLYVPEPDVLYTGNEYAVGRYQNYVNELRRYSVYFNPTIRSPMPRARGEAMMCGLVTVSTQNHDVELFIKNGWNGFYSTDPDELRNYLLFLEKNPQKAKEIGMRGRQTAMDIFNHDRYLNEWEKIFSDLMG